MTTQKITFDREDYSGKQATLTVLGTTESGNEEFTLNELDGNYHWFWHLHTNDDKIVRVMSTDPNQSHIDGFLADDVYVFEQFGLERSDKNPMVAFAKLKWSLM